MLECNRIISAGLPTDIANCKARKLVHSTYCIGAQMQKAAFVHLNVQVMSGRSEDAIKTLSEQLLKALQMHFSQSASALDLQISVNIGELEKTYRKYRSNAAV